MKLLLVEDNLAVRRLIRGVVAPLAEEIIECADGAAALAAYQTHHPDVVLMDIALGAVDGITATRRIMVAEPGAHVIIVTSYDGTDLREAAHQAGACGYVLKENILEVRRLLQTSPLRAPPDERGRPPAEGGGRP